MMTTPTFSLGDDGRGIEQAEDLIEEINTLLEVLPERAENFHRSISEKVDDIATYIEDHNRVTKKQINALENMLYGVQKWIRD